MNTSLGDIQKTIARFFQRYHYVVFFVFIASSLSIAVLIINATVLSDPNDGYAGQTTTTNFDQETITKIEQLPVPGQDTKKLEFSGRSNPF